MRSLLSLISALMMLVPALACGASAESSRGPTPTPGRVYIVLWFDTEDYILPQSDDAAKRIALFLSSQDVRATFKVVGEKARTLERRGRSDVIQALAAHEIGYHANTHSQHPTPAEYEAKLGWQDGVEEFTRRERPGFEDVRRIFGKTPTAYGQPGSSWAPQAFAALRSWGVGVYLDEAGQVGLDGKPFWYGGLLNIFNTREGPQLRPNDQWSNLAEAKLKFQGFYNEMSSRPQGGIISLYFHPCEFVHREFWDGVNFARGANPPRSEWKLPPIKTPEESERAFQYLEGLVSYMKSFPQVQFVSASQAQRLFEDRAQGRVFSRAELAAIAQNVTPEVSFQIHEDYTLAASEVFVLLNSLVSESVRGKALPNHVSLSGTPYGPDLATDASLDFALSGSGLRVGSETEVPWDQFSRTSLDVEDFVSKNQRIPSVVWLGSTAVAPERYYAALGKVAVALLAGQPPPATVEVPPARLAVAEHVAADSTSLWDWVIFPSGFHAPHLMDLARLQAWTLKPAVLDSGP